MGEGALWAPFFHALFRVVAGGRGAAGGRGLPRGACRGDGIGRSGNGVRAGGGWSRGVRAPFFVVWGMEPSFLGAAVFLGEGIVRGKPCGEPPRRQKRRGAFGFFPCRRAHAGAAAGRGDEEKERGKRGGGGGERKGEGREKRGGSAAAGTLESWGGKKRGGGGGKKEEAFGKIAERFVWGLICFAARVLE